MDWGRTVLHCIGSFARKPAKVCKTIANHPESTTKINVPFLYTQNAEGTILGYGNFEIPVDGQYAAFRQIVDNNDTLLDVAHRMGHLMGTNPEIIEFRALLRSLGGSTNNCTANETAERGAALWTSSPVSVAEVEGGAAAPLSSAASIVPFAFGTPTKNALSTSQPFVFGTPTPVVPFSFGTPTKNALSTSQPFVFGEPAPVGTPAAPAINSRTLVSYGGGTVGGTVGGGGGACSTALPRAVSESDLWHLKLPTATNGPREPVVGAYEFAFDPVQKSWNFEIPCNALTNPLQLEVALTDHGVGLMQGVRLDVEASLVPAVGAAPWGAEYVAAVDLAQTRMAFSVSWPRTPGLPHAVLLRLTARDAATAAPMRPTTTGELDTAPPVVLAPAFQAPVFQTPVFAQTPAFAPAAFAQAFSQTPAFASPFASPAASSRVRIPGGRQCATCRACQPQGNFSKSQWEKGANGSCKGCIQAKQVQYGQSQGSRW